MTARAGHGTRPGGSPACLPNLLIAGAAKSGTTSLFRYLEQHPEICASTRKELRYFEPLCYGEPLAPLESYARHFAHCAGQRYRMEASPDYFDGGRVVATAIRETLPDARVLVSLREPVQRCWSEYRFVRSRARIPKEMTFGNYLDACEERRVAGADGPRDNPYSGLRGGCYDERIEAWQELFGDRLRVLFFDDLVADPRGTVEDVLEWLEIDPGPAAAFRLEPENRTVQYRLRGLHRAAVAVNRRAEWFFRHHPALKRGLRRAYYALNRDPVPDRLEPAQQQRLAAFYEPHNRRLASALRSSSPGRWPAWLPVD